MQGVARNFFTLAVIYALVGMMLGLSMAMTPGSFADCRRMRTSWCSAG